MKIMIMPKNFKQVKTLVDKFDSVLIGLKDLSVNMPTYYTYEQFLEIYTFCVNNQKEVFVSLNKNMHNRDLPLLKEMLFKLDKLKITGIVYYDIAIVNIKLENHLKTDLVWGQEHLTTNYITSNYWHNFGSKYTLVSSEITFDEIVEMQKNSKTKLIVTIFGHIPMFVSERHLVKNYLKTFHLKDNSKINYLQMKDSIYPIIDNDDFTVAYSANILNGISFVCKLQKINVAYILLNPFLISDTTFLKVIDLYKQVDDSNALKLEEEINNLLNCDHGFLDRETIYKVKKND